MSIRACAPVLLGCLTLASVSAAQVRDYGNRPAPRTWHLGQQPALRIDPDAVLEDRVVGSVSGIHVRPNGDIVVASEAAGALLMFNRQGTYIRTFGRPGPGPGEFDRVPWMLFAYRDTLVAIDNSGKGQVFSTSGEFAKQIPRPLSTSELFPEIVGVFEDGSVIVSAYSPSSATDADSTLVERVVWRQRPRADTLERLLAFPGYYRKRIGGKPVSVRFDPSGVLAVGARALCIGYTSRYDIGCFDDSGKPIARVRRSVPRRPITEADKDYLRRDHLGSNPRASRQRLEEEVRRTRVAEWAPLFGSVRVSTSGELWVSEFDPSTSQRGAGQLLAPSKPVRWDVFSSLGDWLAQVWLPAFFYPWEFGSDYIAGVAFDQDEEYIEIHRLLRTPVRR
ncbi:MAG: hypothetical protein IT361_02795 [Gemmatimonadaceae bacterium]|nr:hypothetical protein [Gemmatimonadaceae bacterium]